MSFNTIKLRYIVEQELDNQLLDHKEIYWPKVYATLGLDDYPIFDNESGKITYEDCMNRTRLNNKLIRHFYMREIGLETPALFRWYLRDAMHYIMPEFNPMYESLQYLVEPLREYEEFITDAENKRDTENRNHTLNRNGERDNSGTRDMTGTRDASGTRDTSGTRNSSGSRDSEDVFSNTPENMLNTGDIANKRYATTITYDSATDSEQETTTGKETTSNLENHSDNEETVNHETHTEAENGNEDVTRNGDRDFNRVRYGRNQSVMKLVKEYRDALWNIDAVILESPQIANCFMIAMG